MFAAGVHSCMLSFSPLYFCVSVGVCDHSWVCPSLRYCSVLCRFISTNCTAKDILFTA